MFTGIVAGTARVLAIEEEGGVRKINIDLGGFSEGLEIGASVAIDGVCMTVAHINENEAMFEAIDETLERTTLGQIEEGSYVNIERSLKFGDELGGHMISGHIMAKARITERVEREGNLHILIENLELVRPFVMEKGFIAIDGMSLTVGEVTNEDFSLHIIPETLRVTTIGNKVVGSMVNIEIDARTQAIVETMMRGGGGHP
ncbi:MAG: riboflavin synthase [Euryarchaeota archaeon]|nr:riboflavin synthase [Euryarchaeota archaeon]MEC9458270.1 riboflavin synthase subunit alpha [Candidatus Thermoplasmatota archaeon]MED5397910.1 riboflavin synthase subunit alpha [Candidatus Thermoplasmatota archaeon]|tara:strand:- start:9559 stop:10164 length:606 start_codon:yes stop_codon:yes gene_type:complete